MGNFKEKFAFLVKSGKTNPIFTEHTQFQVKTFDRFRAILFTTF